MTTVPVALRRGQPLAPMQRPLWMSQRSHPNAPMQNMALLTHIEGAVDPRRLASAFVQVVEASDVLRTRITEQDGLPLVTLDAEPQDVVIIDLDRGHAESWAAERVKKPLDMSVRGWDSALLVHPDGTLSWYLNLHHTITDATASSLVFDATAAAYYGTEPQLERYYSWAREQGVAPSDTNSPATNPPNGPEPTSGSGSANGSGPTKSGSRRTRRAV